MLRSIIEIDQETCTGCGQCIPNCPEGAIQIIDGKARLVSDLMCDGLGACLGHCPEGAIMIVQREAEEYDEAKVMVNIVAQGANTIAAHLKHLRDHKQDLYHAQAIRYLQDNKIPIPEQKEKTMTTAQFAGCPGSHSQSFAGTREEQVATVGKQPSALTHWPLQMHLISPSAPHYHGADLLLAADCTAFSLGNFHTDFLRGKVLAIACPKLDEGQEIYVDKIRALIDEAKINTLTVMIMQVPCCGGLLNLAKKAAAAATRKIPIKNIVVGLQGQILKEEWV
jgi:ferredoxin